VVDFFEDFVAMDVGGFEEVILESFGVFPEVVPEAG